MITMSKVLDILDCQGARVGEYTIPDEVVELEKGEQALHDAVVAFMAGQRAGTACTKTRGLVSGGGSKPFRQKGMGRARAGSSRSPVWVGGGTIFGPKPRDYSYSLPKKVKRLAMKSLLTLGVKEERLVVVDDFTSEQGKTKDIVSIVKAFGVDKERTLIIMKDNDGMIRRAARNIPNVHVQAYDKLSAKELLYGKKILLLKGAASNLNSFYGER